MIPTVEELRMAALLHDTVRGRPRLAETLKKFGANKVSAIQPEQRLPCLLGLLRLKMQAKHDYWSTTS